MLPVPTLKQQNTLCFKYTAIFDLAPSVEVAQHEPTLQNKSYLKSQGEQAQSLTVTQVPLQ